MSQAVLCSWQGRVPPTPSATVSQQGKQGTSRGTVRFSQESWQVCSGEADSRSSRLQVRVQMGRVVAVDQHSYSTAQAGAEGPRLTLKWGPGMFAGQEEAPGGAGHGQEARQCPQSFVGMLNWKPTEVSSKQHFHGF